MKYFFTLCILLGVNALIISQSKDYFKPLGSGNTDALAQVMKSEVEFCINSGQKNISKTEALGALKAFLADVKPKSCRKMHDGDSKVAGSYFQVGKLKTEKGNYRVFIYFEQDKIVELRIDDY